jgi:hypothetical protein
MMIRTILSAGVILAAAPSMCMADTSFRGNVVFTAIKNCKSGVASVGEQYKSQYHTPMPGNQNFSAISLVYRYGAIGHKLDNAKFNTTFQETASGGVGWGDSYTPERPTYVLISSQQPSTLTPTTPSVIISGKFKNQWGDPGDENCEVTFRGVYVRRLQ